VESEEMAVRGVSVEVLGMKVEGGNRPVGAAEWKKAD